LWTILPSIIIFTIHILLRKVERMPILAIIVDSVSVIPCNYHYNLVSPLMKEMYYVKEKQNIIDQNDSSITEGILNGPIIPLTLRIAMPFLLGQMLVMLYGVADTLFISMIDNSSTALISGVGLVLPIYMLFVALGVGIYTGVGSLVARGIGEKNTSVLNKAADSGLFLSLIIAAVSIVVLSLFGKDILRLLAGGEMSKEAINNAIQYLYHLIPGLGLLIFFYSLLGILQGEGLTKYYASSMLLATIANIVLDPIFIFAFGLGTAGAGLATSIAILSATIFIVGVFLTNKSSLKIKWNAFNSERKLIFEIVRIGMPQMISVLFVSVAIMFLNNLIGSISQDAMNSWVLVVRMDEFIIMVGYAFGASALTLAGQNYGGRNYKRVLDVYKTNVLMGMMVAAVFVLIYNLAARSLFSLFTSLPYIIEWSVAQVRIVAFTHIGVVGTLIVINAFQATGRALPGLMLHGMRMVLLTIPVSYCMVIFFNKGTHEIFLTIGAANIITFIVAFIWCYCYLKKIDCQVVPKKSYNVDVK